MSTFPSSLYAEVFAGNQSPTTHHPNLMSDFQKVAWHNLVQKPILDRIFYVPFWECPHRCDFCCVDSKPGKPPENPIQGEQKLLELMDAMYDRTNTRLQVHIFGGEPLLRPDIITELSKKLATKKSFKKLYLYTTLRHEGIEKVVEAIGKENIRIVINTETVNDKVRARMKNLKKIAELYHNIVFFPTGRGKEGTSGHKKTWLEKLPVASMPGKSCFANASGMLVNGPHQTVHLCCLPQSPVIGNLNDTSSKIVAQYDSTLSTWHKEVHSTMKQKGYSHACSVCEELSQWNPENKPNTAIANFQNQLVPVDNLLPKTTETPITIRKTKPA